MNLPVDIVSLFKGFGQFISNTKGTLLGTGNSKSDVMIFFWKSLASIENKRQIHRELP
jgi:hypothetical protein